jgi:hypothetical protein
MSKSQQSETAIAFARDLVRGTAITLPAVSKARRLRVTEGRLWLTLTSPVSSSDEWLQRNDEFDLSAGESAVLEAWPCARFEVLAPVNNIVS